MTTVGKKTCAALLLSAMLSLSLGACARPLLEVHGYMPTKANVDRLRPGVHNIASVQQLLGSPSAITRFRHRSWLYVTQRSETKAFFAPKVLDRRVLELTFDPKGILKEVKRYSLKDGKKLEYVEEVTPTRGNELTVLQQLFGNLGRFSTTEGQ